MAATDPVTVAALIEGGRYEEAMGVPVNASRAQLNRAHITGLHRFRENPVLRESLNRIKGILAAESRTQKADRLIRTGLFEQTVEFLSGDDGPGSSAQEHHLLGFVLQRLGRNAEALVYLEAAVELRGSLSDRVWLGNVLETEGRLLEAVDQYRIVVEQRGGSFECRLLGDVLVQLGSLDEAALYIERAAMWDPLDMELARKRKQLRRKTRLKRIRRLPGRMLNVLNSSEARGLDHAVVGVSAASGVLFAIGGNVSALSLIGISLVYVALRIRTSL